ncbi:MAG: hypothetical protein ACYS9X_07050 [Planctomycetota bacterium]|jgi:hypothetical protein
MSDPGTPEHPGPRFPWGPALLAAASVVLAAWLWMRYSYAWAVTPSRLRREAGFASSRKQSWDRAYARLEGARGIYLEFRPRVDVARIRVGELVREETNGKTVTWSAFTWSLPHIDHAVAVTIPRRDMPEPFRRDEWTGRVEAPSSSSSVPGLDATAGRLTPESVAGLVVGAWGTFVFAMYLRRWLASRRA